MLIDEANLPTDKTGRALVLTGACLILQDTLIEILDQDLTITQARGLINNKIDKIKELLDE